MKIVSISTVRNESDIIETFIRYHLRFFDHMIVVNHRSIDSTFIILENLYKEGLPIEIINYNSIEQPQQRVLTEMMKRAVRIYQADWVFPLDADEFIVYKGDGGIRDRLSQLSSDTVYRIFWKNYIPTPNDNQLENNILKRICYRKRNKSTVFKVLISGDIAKRKDTFLSFGSHRLLRKILFKEREWRPIVLLNDIYIAHFPIRSEKQIITKAIIGWLCNIARPDRKEGQGFHHKEIFYRFISKNGLTYDEIKEIALNYGWSDKDTDNILIYDPVISPDDNMILKYTKGYECEPLKMLGLLSEDFAMEVGRLKKKYNG